MAVLLVQHMTRGATKRRCGGNVVSPMRTSDLVEKKSWNWRDGCVKRVLCCASERTEVPLPSTRGNSYYGGGHLSLRRGVDVQWKWRQEDCLAVCQCSTTFSERLPQEDKERVVEQGQLMSSFVTQAHP